MPFRASVATCLFVLATVPTRAFAESHLTIRVRDSTGDPLPCRVHLEDADGTPQQADGLPFWRDHFVCPGEASVTVSPGSFRYVIERGPEYRRLSGEVTISDKDHELDVSLVRLIDMSSRQWWSGELHIHRAIEELPLHMQAEDLHIGPTITWWNGRDLWKQRDLPESTRRVVDTNRFYDIMAGEDEREGGALLYFGLKKPLPLPGGKGEFPEHPSPMTFLTQARERQNVWIDIEKPFWWDVPVWLASGQVDSIGLANNHMCRSRMYESEAWGRPRDVTRLPAPRGNGIWTQDIYYHILNCGLRIPPSAGSASGVLPNPVGYNRVYVHTGQALKWTDWWNGLKAGRSFVTNGPILLATADGELPGHAFEIDAETRAIRISAKVVSNDPFSSIEVVNNGEVITVAGIETNDPGVGPHRMTVDTSIAVKPGWFLIRVITDRKDTFRFASTAPWFIDESGKPRRVSRRSVEFFADWIEERTDRVPQKLKDAKKLREVLAHHDTARRFWNDLLNRTNAP